LESTAWHARQFFSLASCSLADAAPDTNALRAIAATRIRFMSISINLMTAEFYIFLVILLTVKTITAREILRTAITFAHKL
jgi:hypothetical protein